MHRLVPITILLALAACQPSVETQATGAEIFDQLCARCHGPDLAGGIGPAIGAGSRTAENPDSYIETTVTRGRGRMPSFGRVLDDAQLDLLVSYIRERQADG